MLMQMIPSADAIGQDDCEASRTIGARTFVTCAAFTHAATLGRAFRIGRLENEAREISRKMNDVLAWAAREFKDYAGRWQDITKTSRMKSRLRTVAGAYWRWSIIVLAHSTWF
jgi:hypothetical protein